MPGIGDDITSLLSNPAILSLLPAVTGAVGGMLGSPRLAGGRGALASGLAGGTQGLETGIQTSLEAAKQKQEAEYQKMLTQHYALEDKISQNDLDAENKTIAHFNSLPPAEQAKYGNDWHTYLDVNKQVLVNQIGSEGLRDLAVRRMSTATGKAEFARQGYTDPSQLAGLDKDQLNNLLTGTAPPTPTEQARLDIEKATQAREAAYQQSELGLRRQEIAQTGATEAQRLALERANEPLVPVADPSSPSGYVYRERAGAVGKAAPPPAATTGLVVTADPGSTTGFTYTPRTSAAGAAAPIPAGERPKQETPSEVAAREAKTANEVIKNYTDTYGKPSIIRGSAWQAGLSKSLVAAGFDPFTHAPLSNAVGDSSQPDGTMVHNSKGEIGGVYHGKVYKLSSGG